VGTKIDVRVAGQLLECFASNQRVAGHAFSAVRGGFTTTPEHMPASHRAHLQWTPAKLISWGQRIGVSTAAVVTWQLEHRPHPEQGYRACLGLLALVRRYSAQRLEAACTRAMAIRAPNLRSVTNILKCGLDRQPSLFPATSSPAIEHENVHGRTTTTETPSRAAVRPCTAALGALDRRLRRANWQLNATGLCKPPG
jgi:transposase